MTWSRFDDGYDEHDKVEEAWDAERATIGLHVQATTACNRWSSDGVIKPRWLRGKLPERKERARVLAAMVEHALFDLLPAGETRAVHDSDGNPITVGPFAEDRYVVHDFLDRHDSSLQVKARRQADAKRKRAGRRKDSNGSPTGVQPDTAGTPTGLAKESNGSPLTGGRAGPRPHPDPTLPNPETPLAPHGGNLPELPAKPKGNRKTELTRFDEQVQAYAAARFSDIPEPERSQMVRGALGAGSDTHERVAAYVRRWCPAPDGDLPANVRDGIAQLGARVVDINRHAKDTA